MGNQEVLNALHELGFIVKQKYPDSYAFKFERLNYLYSFEEEDESFCAFNIPCIYEVEDEHYRPAILDIINEINARLKYTKLILHDDSVWASYEMRLNKGMELEDAIHYAILILRASVDNFYEKVNGGGIPKIGN